MRKTEIKAQPKRSVNLLSFEQVEAILDGINQSAFSIAIAEGDETTAVLSTGGKEIFRIDLVIRAIFRKRDGNTERIYSYGPDRFLRTNPDRRLFTRLEEAIRVQYATGGHEAYTTNLITRSEVIVLIDAIRAMAFKIDSQGLDTMILFFDGREVFRIGLINHTISLVGLSRSAEVVYTFVDEPESWFWAGTDRKLLKDLTAALGFYNEMMHKVRMADYRAMFGDRMQKVITGLAAAMDEAEADVRLLERVDKTRGGSSLHPDVARLVQKDLDAGEEAAAAEEEQG